MNPLKCDEVKDSLIDYLEFELPINRREHLFEHLSQCADCQAIHDELQQTLTEAKKIRIPEPPQSFWDALPEKVLNDVKELQKQHEEHDENVNVVEAPTLEKPVTNGRYDDGGKVIDFSQAIQKKNTAQTDKHKQDAGQEVEQELEIIVEQVSGSTQINSSKKSVASPAWWPRVALPIAAAILVGLSAIFLFLESEQTYFHGNVEFQAQIQSDQPLAELAQKLDSLSQSGSLFGFSSQQRNVNGFYIGSKFSEVKVYADLNYRNLLKTQLAILGSALQNETKVQPDIVERLAQLQNQLELQDGLSDVKPKINQLFDQYVSSIKSRDSDRYQLVMAGAWLFDYSLAVLARDDVSIKQPDQLSALEKYLQAFAPPGAIQSLDKVRGIIQQPGFTERDYKIILKEIENVRSLLG